MRMRDRPSFPEAPHGGTYGCGRCGTYHRLKAGDKLACNLCRSPRALIATAAPAGQPAGDRRGPPQSSQATGTAVDRSG